MPKEGDANWKEGPRPGPHPETIHDWNTLGWEQYVKEKGLDGNPEDFEDEY